MSAELFQILVKENEIKSLLSMEYIELNLGGFISE